MKMKIKLIAVALLCLAMGTTVSQVQKTKNSLTNKQTEKK